MARPRGKRLLPQAFDYGIQNHPDGPITRMAIAAGVMTSPGALSDLYSGRRRAGDELAEALADFLKMPKEILFPEFGPFMERDGATDEVAA